MTVSLDRGLELLLKYRPALYAQGRLAFDAPRPAAWALALVGSAFGAAGVWAYRARGVDDAHAGARRRAQRGGDRARRRVPAAPRARAGRRGAAPQHGRRAR